MRENTSDLARILIVGNPNAGKSTLFNALTGGHARVGNWHGVTVGVLEKQTVLNGKRFLICDLPGIYSFPGMTMEEKETCSYIGRQENAFLLFTAECALLPRALELLRTLAPRRRFALVLTKRRAFERAGGKVNLRALQKELGVSVFYAEGGKKRLRAETAAAFLSAGDVSDCVPFAADGAVERILRETYVPARDTLSRADGLLTNAFFAIPLFFAFLLVAFYVTFAPDMPGDCLKNAVQHFFTETLSAYARRISSPIARGFVCDGVLNSLGNVLCFLPQITLLFFFLNLLEESGFLSRLAMLLDGAFSKIGLSGRVVFSLLMGFGCTAAAVMTTRGLEDKRLQKRVILCLPYISCSAKLPVFLTLASGFFDNAFYAVILLYAFGVMLAVLAVVLMKGEGEPPFVAELAPLHIPSAVFLAKALYFQIKQFIIKLATVIFAFFLASWLLSSFSFSFGYCSVEESMLADLCGWLKYLFAPIGCGDWKIAYAALSGLIAKENVAGALALFYGGFPYSAASAFAFAVFILACSPCVSAIAACARELGWKRALRYAVFQTGSALLLSYFVYFLLRGGGYVLIPLIPAVLLLSGRKKLENIHRKRRKQSQRFHR